MCSNPSIQEQSIDLLNLNLHEMYKLIIMFQICKLLFAYSDAFLSQTRRCCRRHFQAISFSNLLECAEPHGFFFVCFAHKQQEASSCFCFHRFILKYGLVGFDHFAAIKSQVLFISLIEMKFLPYRCVDDHYQLVWPSNTQYFTKPDYRMSLLVVYTFRSIT